MRRLWLFLGLLALAGTARAGFMTDALYVTSSTTAFNGTTYYWQAGSGGPGQVLKNSGGTITSSTLPFNFSLEPLTAKTMSPGTTAYPVIDNSTNAAIASAYWDQASTQTLTWATELTPYAGTGIFFDFNFTGSTITTGNVEWSVSMNCVGLSTPTVTIDNLYQGYALDISTAGVIPSTAGFVALLEAGPYIPLTCVQGQEVGFLVTRNHAVASDAAGQIRLFSSKIHE